MEKNVQILKARGRQTMWKIFIEYDNKSKLTITGKHKDNPYRKDRELYPHCPWCGQKLKEAEDETEKENQQAE